MHVQDCISNNISGEIAKLEITSCLPGRYTRAVYCHTIFVIQCQALYSHVRSRKRYKNVFSGRIESHWYFVGGFRWYWLVPCFSSYGLATHKQQQRPFQNSSFKLLNNTKSSLLWYYLSTPCSFSFHKIAFFSRNIKNFQ